MNISVKTLALSTAVALLLTACGSKTAPEYTRDQLKNDDALLAEVLADCKANNGKQPEKNCETAKKVDYMNKYASRPS